MEATLPKNMIDRFVLLKVYECLIFIIWLYLTKYFTNFRQTFGNLNSYIHIFDAPIHIKYKYFINTQIFIILKILI